MEKRRNYSRKREAILNAVRSTTSHPTADWVYEKLKPEYPDLSLGTVYRNLAQFKQDGTIISVGVVNGQERYDGNVKPHTHFVCSKCGSVIDIPDDYIGADRIEQAERKYRLRIDSTDILLRGVCPDCLKKAE
ncbi:Peroxide-responsive repressor PerR [Caprobacter fermentans]|uniref:Peroxide-responsive repressor PerR n=1 Tax=Caproicibacter fermentans TaxID=2576756 RepID=A0A6N8HYI4_9FIRM|nr:transcriptional repressor [Caproicibacter fermentans]MVB10403.1 Peroxide-responsive repressor PerR [Caproicibacter fermentans]OCN01897.1 transcriptional repressor [Clostridium sp. W14A]QNK40377.1 transcriptional repressor [Caproicibacter fermentans]